jgi:phosphotransferase system  glucose/maltose/N-acetylglucosamine-specific IIC component
MKKLLNNTSPFLMLLIPVFIVVGLLLLNVDKEIPADKYQASINLQMPSIKALVQTIF